MTEYLLIVESPGKIKKIQSFIPNNYHVMASVGHVDDLDSKSLSIDIANNFKPTYVINPDKKKVISNIKNNIKDKIVLLCSDQDYEGEKISDSLRNILKLSNNNYQRITFNEITKNAILKALEKPRKIDELKVNAQQTRRILDRLVGYKISPILNQVQAQSAGRVQSVIVRLLVEHEEKIKEFYNLDNDTHYEGFGNFKIEEKELDTILYLNNKKVIIKNYEEIKELINNLGKSKWKIEKIEKSKSSKSPSAPFITSTLQQSASSNLHFSVKKTMQIAQQLYESGYITYMRTDSPTLSEEAHKMIKKYIKTNYGDEYYKYKQYASKNKNAQEAHECIRPTNIETLTCNISSDAKRLYEMIWKKTVSSQMSNAELEITTITILSDFNSYQMIGKLERLIFDGFLKIYQDEYDKEIIDITKDSLINLIELKGKEIIAHPPTRYNEATLVKKLESLSIGRPSTYASMISKIQDHNYAKIEDISGQEKELKEVIYKNKNIIEKIVKINLGKESKRLVPTELGEKVTKFLIENFPEIMNYDFTAKLEDDLDKIANGEKIWYQVLKEFNDILDKHLLKFNKNEINKKQFNKNNLDVIGQNPETKKDIYYLKTKYGYAIKTEKNSKDIFVSVKEKPSLEQAIDMINSKKESELVKKIGKYQIKNGPYGPYIQVGNGKNIKFYKIKDKDPKTLDINDCELIIKKK